MAKIEKEEREAQDKEIELAIKSGMHNTTSIAEEASVMKAYSLAIANQAESSEPETPVNFGTAIEKQEEKQRQTEAMYNAASDEE